MELEWLSVSKFGTLIFAHRNKGINSTGGFYFEALYKLFKYNKKDRVTQYQRVLPWEFMV